MADWGVTQEGQTARITTALGAENAFLEAFTAVEALSEPFRITCQIVCPKKHSFLEHRGTGVSLEVKEGGTLVKRAFHGVLTEATLVEAVDQGYRFDLTVRPWFWVLSLGRQSRIFPKKSARDIIKEVFEKAGVGTSQYSFSGLSARGTIVREYTVQFEESDFAFVSRLMEEEGIYYYFEHTANQHVMTLCDSPSAHTDFPNGDIVVRDEATSGIQTPHLVSLTRRLRSTINEYATRDQHWRKFGDPLDAKSEIEGGQGLIKPSFFEYPGGFAYLTDDGATEGADFALLRLQADEADAFVHTGYGDTFAVPTGAVINIDWEGSKAKMMVCGTTHRLSGQRISGMDDADPTVTTVEIDCVDVALNWRPKRVTPKPCARGPQVATVVGRSGQEIDIDDMGRVMVQFPWDRYGQSNEKSSCRVRVSSGWAGPSMGEYMNPRVGQEVLVSYIDGDMDRPVITGRVFDSKNIYTPPKTETDYVSDRSAQSGWITQTVGGPSGQDYDGAVVPPTDNPGFNAILFDDRSGKEQVFIRGQRDARTTIYRDRMEVIHRDETDYIGRHLLTEVETGDETHKVVKGKRTTTINQDETLTVEQGNRTMTIETGDETLKVSKGNMSTEVSMGNQDTAIKMGNQSTDVKLGNISIKADLGKIDIEAMQSITLKVGSSSIVVDQVGVTISGTVMVQVKGIMTQVNGDAMLTLKGGITMIN